MADWIAEEAKHFGIPITDLSSSSAQSGGRGVCYHSELGSSGCGHSDPGSGFPLDKVLEWARGGGTTSPTPASGGDMAVGVAVDPDGNKHYVAIGAGNGELLYFPPGWSNWGRVDNAQSGAKSGAGIVIDDKWWVSLTYTNASGQPCQYRKKFGEGDWAWSEIGDVNAR
jgi:hypothetical protein